MARAIPENRIRDLADTAIEVFIRRGYRRTQMSDVAAELGVAKGTIYTYVESKEALFDLAVQRAIESDDMPQPMSLPIATPVADATLSRVQAALAEAGTFRCLVEALSRDTTDDITEELSGILNEIFAVQTKNRKGLKLLDRCSSDYPELAALFFKNGREGLMQLLLSYYERRSAAGQLRLQVDPLITVRVVLETLTTWAVHRHWDPWPQAMDDDVARDTVIDMLVTGLVAKP